MSQSELQRSVEYILSHERIIRTDAGQNQAIIEEMVLIG